MKKTLLSLFVFLILVVIALGGVMILFLGKATSVLHLFLLAIIFLFSFLLLYITFFMIGVFLVIKGFQPVWLLKFVFFSLKLLFPFLLLLGRFQKNFREQIQREFIFLNNLLVEKIYFSQKSPFKSVMILLPHCLQWSDCPLKITYNVENCKECGKCDIAGLLKLTHQYGIKMFVATGGTLARRIIKENRPDFIIACACEEDLSLGIFDVRKIPVYGILNDRPFGPCFNTKISVEKVAEVLGKLQFS